MAMGRLGLYHTVEKAFLTCCRDVPYPAGRLLASTGSLHAALEGPRRSVLRANCNYALPPLTINDIIAHDSRPDLPLNQAVFRLIATNSHNF